MKNFWMPKDIIAPENHLEIPINAQNLQKKFMENLKQST
jgi:hypothetical protein